MSNQPAPERPVKWTFSSDSQVSAQRFDNPEDACGALYDWLLICAHHKFFPPVKIVKVS